MGEYRLAPAPTIIPLMPSHIQTDPGWRIETGPSINGTPDGGIPTIKLTPNPPWVPDGLLLTIQGVPGKYADGVARSPGYDLPANTGHAHLYLLCALDAASLLFAQGQEVGIKITLPSGLTLNGQIQFTNYSATEMILCLTSVSGAGWTRTKVILPKFAPNVRHRLDVGYRFTDTDISVVAVHVDGVAYPTPPDMKCVVGRKLGWDANKYQVNLQANTNKLGGTWEWMIYQATVTFA